jgi:interleukin-1 receptor-associated kinase 1
MQVVPKTGWSYNKGEPLLIYEYMKNGSLDQHLFQSGGFGQGRKQQDTALGNWVTRYSIARDIAMGLQYLHHEHEPMVLHRDIKSSNIMLDSTFCARLGDFGIACTVNAERSSVTGVAGTIGYMGPEYVVNYKATRQTDIFAFGVVILEIVTGKKNMQVPADDGHITQWVRRLHHEGALLEALDDKLTPSGTDVAVEAQRLLLLGLACTSPNPSSRPSMTEVLQVINKLVPPPELSFEQPLLGWMPEESSSVSSSEYGGLPEANQVGQGSSKEQRPLATGGGHVSISFTQSEDVAPADASDQQTGR